MLQTPRPGTAARSSSRRFTGRWWHRHSGTGALTAGFGERAAVALIKVLLLRPCFHSGAANCDGGSAASGGFRCADLLPAVHRASPACPRLPQMRRYIVAAGRTRTAPRCCLSRCHLAVVGVRRVLQPPSMAAWTSLPWPIGRHWRPMSGGQSSEKRLVRPCSFCTAARQRRVSRFGAPHFCRAAQ